MTADGLWRGDAPLLLASTSRTRLALLQALGLPVDTEAPGIDERAFEAARPGPADPAGLAADLAREKALGVSRRRPGRLVLGADQVLDLDGVAMSKPADEPALLRQLESLSGRTHRLRTAAVLARDGAVLSALSDTATLAMRDLDRAAILRYVALVGPSGLASAGGYAVEGLGLHLFRAIDGRHPTILGLPLLPLLDALRALGFLKL